MQRSSLEDPLLPAATAPPQLPQRTKALSECSPHFMIAIFAGIALLSGTHALLYQAPMRSYSSDQPPSQSQMETLLSVAIDDCLDIADTYVSLGSAYEVPNFDSHRMLLNNDHSTQQPDAMAVQWYNKSLEVHDYAVTLANWLNTLGGEYAPAWGASFNSTHSLVPDLREDGVHQEDLEAVGASLERRLSELRQNLRNAAVALHDWPTLSFLRLAAHSTLHDPAPEAAPSAAELADLPSYHDCTGFSNPAPRPPLCGSSLPPIDGPIRLTALALAHSMLHSSRTSFALAAHRPGGEEGRSAQQLVYSCLARPARRRVLWRR